MISEERPLTNNVEHTHNNFYFEIFDDFSNFIHQEKTKNITKEDLDELFCKVMSVSQTVSSLIPTFYSSLVLVSLIMINEFSEEKAQELMEFIITKYNLDIDKFSNDILFIREITDLKAKIKLFD